MRRTTTSLNDNRETTVDFPDAFEVNHDPAASYTMHTEDEVQGVLEKVREEVIQAMNEARPPVFHVPPGMVLKVHPASFVFMEAEGEEDD